MGGLFSPSRFYRNPRHVHSAARTASGSRRPSCHVSRLVTDLKRGEIPWHVCCWKPPECMPAPPPRMRHQAPYWRAVPSPHRTGRDDEPGRDGRRRESSNRRRRGTHQRKVHQATGCEAGGVVQSIRRSEQVPFSGVQIRSVRHQNAVVCARAPSRRLRSDCSMARRWHPVSSVGSDAAR